MPNEYNGRIAVRSIELIPVFFSNYEALKKTLQRYKDKSHGIKRLQSGGNGRELLIDFDSLDIEIRRALGDPRTVTNWMDSFFKMHEVARQYYCSYEL